MNELRLSDAQTAQLARFAELVAGSPHNLMSARARDELLSRHVPEAVELGAVLPPRARCLDLGSGGGLPGMVVAIVRPELEVHLLDATAKKAGFLQATATELSLSVHVHLGRAEELAQGVLRASFPLVTARAVAPLRRLVPWAAPFLAPAGRLYAVKGENWATELEDAAAAIERAGLTVLGTPETDPQLGPDPRRPHAPKVVMIGRST